MKNQHVWKIIDEPDVVLSLFRQKHELLEQKKSSAVDQSSIEILSQTGRKVCFLFQTMQASHRHDSPSRILKMIKSSWIFTEHNSALKGKKQTKSISVILFHVKAEDICLSKQEPIVIFTMPISKIGFACFAHFPTGLRKHQPLGKAPILLDVTLYENVGLTLFMLTQFLSCPFFFCLHFAHYIYHSEDIWYLESETLVAVLREKKVNFST
jgi:hypothetical protein